MRITMRDIAEKAGVSPSTVSLALSRHPRIPERTQKRIRDIAESMGYEGVRGPDQSVPPIALLLSNPGQLVLLHEALEGIMAETTAAHAPLQLVNFQGAIAESGDELLKEFQETGVKGAIILGGGFSEHVFRRLCEEDFPFICIGKRDLKGFNISWVSSDYINGARQGTEHLLKMGHRTVALAYDKHYQKVMFRERIIGYQLALSEGGATEGPHWMINNMDEAVAALQNEWPSRDIPAVFTTNGKVAARILRACGLLGIDVPGELAVVSFDDEPGSALLGPPLTSVKQPLREMGATATRTLLSWLRGAPQGIVQTRLQTELIVRESCGA